MKGEGGKIELPCPEKTIVKEPSVIRINYELIILVFRLLTLNKLMPAELINWLINWLRKPIFWQNYVHLVDWFKTPIYI